jgi:uncharacterized membrane protein
MLSLRSRLCLGAAAVLLLGMFAFPLWRVSLAAPQYPEGLGMEIGIRTITGFTPNDLGNINNLNHYIGMKRIVPEAIPELRYMPWIVGALVALGALAALAGRRAIAITFVVAFIVLAVAGMADFWRWEYDYGHNLDLVNAIIRIPGMSYQPPLIGSRQLLNFTATSLPGLGAWFAFAAAGLAVTALWRGRGPRTNHVQQAVPLRAA